jgi:hypothetical protein
MNGYRITKRAFYAAGGFSNPRLYRRMVSGRWQHYRESAE